MAFRLLLTLLLTVSCFAEQQPPTVVVVGAGLAGLTAAYRLQQQGMDVHVYDARNRVGGRILSVQIGNSTAELGGQNITDGGAAENMRRLIDEFHLELTEYRVNLAHSYFDGTTLIPAHLLYNNKYDPETLRAQLTRLAQTARTMREVLDTLFNPQDPLYKTLAVRLAGYEGDTVDKLSSFYVETLLHMLMGGISSAHQNGSVNIVTIRGGNEQLPQALAQALGDNVHLNMPLIAVAKAPDDSYELTFQNGQKTHAHILVLAIPCSVYDDIHFEQNLIPEERLDSIRSVQYGTNGKILVPFSPPPPNRMYLVSDRVGLFSNHDRTVFTLYYTGDAGRFTPDTLLETYQQERPLLEIGFKDFCPPPSIPQMARDESFATYDGPVGYSWPNDPYVKGSYAYIAPGQEGLLTATETADGETVKTLFAPIDHTLYFAGEHATILIDVAGTMEAACESGERTARMIHGGQRFYTRQHPFGDTGLGDIPTLPLPDSVLP